MDPWIGQGCDRAQPCARGLRRLDWVVKWVCAVGGCFFFVPESHGTLRHECLYGIGMEAASSVCFVCGSKGHYQVGVAFELVTKIPCSASLSCPKNLVTSKWGRKQVPNLPMKLPTSPMVLLQRESKTGAFKLPSGRRPRLFSWVHTDSFSSSICAGGCPFVLLGRQHMRSHCDISV